jgi:hypothetical protein
MSRLPVEVVQILTTFLQRLDALVQSDVYTVVKARREHDAFGRNHVVMTLHRALVCRLAADAAASIPGITIEELGSSGWEAVVRAEGRTNAFRWKKADIDTYGRLVVTTDSDSLLSRRLINRSQQLSLFETGDAPLPGPVVDDDGNEMWVLAYLLDRTTLGFRRIATAWPSGFSNRSAPYKLVLEDQRDIELIPPVPPSFPRDDDDLFEDDHDEGETGEGLSGA